MSADAINLLSSLFKGESYALTTERIIVTVNLVMRMNNIFDFLKVFLGSSGGYALDAVYPALCVMS